MNAQINFRFGESLKRFEPIDPQTIAVQTSKLFEKKSEKIDSILFLGRGEASAVFKVKTDKSLYALKTALYPERTQKILNEAKIRRMFIDKGVTCVPAPIFTDQEFFINGAVVFEYAEGVNSNYQDESTIRKMAQSLAEIHTVDYKIIPDGYEQMKNNHQFLKKSMNHIKNDYPHLVNPAITEAFSLALDEYEKKIDENRELFPFGISGIMHGDLGGHFLTDSNGKVWLVDWENSEYGDLIEEVSTFIFSGDISVEMRKMFFDEYKANFTPASEIDLERIGYFYIFPQPAYNVCWGIDQLHTNLIHKLEPERKLVDIKSSAENWKKFFSESAASMILEGVNEMTLQITTEYKLCM